ncbi:hypothetical protein [Streptomyces luteireticuli]|uniref:hypothetical protein n=1 Tax=Streptomyces luteireticuli TaxID=173858 RepID=UPI003556EFCF
MHDFRSDDILRCEARVSGPDDPEVCANAAVFEINRHLDTTLGLCPAHLGPLLLGARNVLWPPQVQLLDDPGGHPEEAVVAGSSEAQRREAGFHARLGRFVDMPEYGPTSPRCLVDALLAVDTPCPAAGAATSSKDVPVLLGALLAAVETGLVLSGSGPESVGDVLRGCKSASDLVPDTSGWATMLHFRLARTAAEVERVLDSDTAYAAGASARLASRCCHSNTSCKAARYGRRAVVPPCP